MKTLNEILKDTPGYRVYARIGHAFMNIYRSERDDKDEAYENLGKQGEKNLLQAIVKYPIGTEVYYIETGGMFRGGLSITKGRVSDIFTRGDLVYYIINPGEGQNAILNELCVFADEQILIEHYKYQFDKLFDNL